jgi:hypothetical protein
MMTSSPGSSNAVKTRTIAGEVPAVTRIRSGETLTPRRSA